MKPISLLNKYTSPFSNCNKQLFLLNKLNLALISFWSINLQRPSWGTNPTSDMALKQRHKTDEIATNDIKMG